MTTVPTVVYENSSEAEKGIVIRQEPAAGADFKKDDPLTLIVSNGTGSDIMPNVTNMDRAQAEKVLLENGIEWDQIVEDTKGDAPVGYVIEQHPAAGESVSESGSVWLTVKASPDTQKISVPNIQSMQLADALNVLQLKDLNLFFVYEKESGEEEGTVISQNPPENTEISVNDPVALTIPSADGKRYQMKDEFSLNIPKDVTSVRIGVPGNINGVPVYYIIYDTIMEAGDHVVEPGGTVYIDSDEEIVQQDVVLFLNDVQVRTETVEFTRR